MMREYNKVALLVTLLAALIDWDTGPRPWQRVCKSQLRTATGVRKSTHRGQGVYPHSSPRKRLRNWYGRAMLSRNSRVRDTSSNGIHTKLKNATQQSGKPE
jgi:hypothetical protein